MRNIAFYFLILSLFMGSAMAVDDSLLFSAAIRGDTDRIKDLLADGAEVNAMNSTGRTAMMAASFNGNLRVVRVLLAYGADVNLADEYGNTALMDAVMFGREELVNLLITAGADVNAKDKKGISVIEKSKTTPYTHIVKILEPLVAVEAEQEQGDSADGKSAESNSKKENNKE